MRKKIARKTADPNRAAQTIVGVPIWISHLSWARIGRWSLSFTLGLTVCLALGYLTPRRVKPSAEACAVTIYVSGDRFHTSLIVPVEAAHFDWRQQLNLADLGQDGQNTYRYLSFNWGDRRFYLNTPSLQALKISTTLRALLLPTDTVMYVQGYRQRPQNIATYQVQSIQLSQSGYEHLTTHLLKSFARKADDARPILVQQHPDETGLFYAGTGRYGFWQTCNDWVAQGLRAADVQTPMWSGFAGSIFHHLSDGCASE